MKKVLLTVRKSWLFAAMTTNKRQIGAWLWLVILVAVGINFPIIGAFMLGVQLQAILSSIVLLGKDKVIENYKWLLVPQRPVL